MRLLKTFEKLNKFGIPSGYKRVEYLESTGTQYINTGLRLTQNNAIEVCYKINSISNFSGIVGARTSASSNNIAVNANIGGTSAPFIGVDFNNSNFENYRARYDTRTSDKILAYLDKHIRKISINNSVVASNNTECTDAVETQANCLLFRVSGINGYCDLNMYYCKIWDNDTLVRDFIPCLDNNGIPCMYDLVGKKTYYNQGTGADFSYGRQIILVKYLESTGTQYIDTGITGTNENMGIDVTWAFSNNDANMCIFSSRSAQTSNTLTLFWLKTISNRIRFDGRGQIYFTEGVNASVSDDIFNFNYKSADGAVATLTNETTGQVQTTTIGKLKTFSTKPLYLFASRDTADVYSWIKMYSCRIYDGSTILRDYIPCIDENNVPFMYDLVTNTIYENKGTDSFLFGEEVYDYKLQTRLLKDNSLPAGYTQVDYIEAKNSGNDIQYAVSDYRLTDTTDWEITFSASASSSNWVLGQPTWIGVHYKKDTSTSNLPKVAITNSSVAASQCYVDYTDNEKITLALKGTDVYANGVKAGSITRKSAPATQTKYGLFAYKDISQDLPNLRIQSARIYRLKIWDNGVLVQDLIPAIKEGAAGFYERINKIFIEKESNSTSDFTTGKPVLPVTRFLGGRDFSKYTFLNYLESTGTQYIDTGVVFSDSSHTYKWDIGAQAVNTSNTNYNWFCGFFEGGAYSAGTYADANTNYNFYAVGAYYQDGQVITTPLTNGDKYGIIRNVFTITNFAGTLPIILFGRNQSNGVKCEATKKIFYYKIYNNNALVRNLIPALRKSDNKPGMLDIITKQFFTNAGTGEFLFG